MWCHAVSCDVVSCDVMSCDPLWNSSSSLLFYTYLLTYLLNYLLTYLLVHSFDAADNDENFDDAIDKVKGESK